MKHLIARIVGLIFVNAKPSACSKKYHQGLPEKQDLMRLSQSCLSYGSNFVPCPQFADAALPAIVRMRSFQNFQAKRLTFIMFNIKIIDINFNIN